MGNEYMVIMTDNDDESPYHIKDVAWLVRSYNDCKKFESLEDAIKACHNIVKLYGLSPRQFELGIAKEMSKHGIGADVIFASGKNRYLHIVKVEDQNQSLARFLAGKA